MEDDEPEEKTRCQVCMSGCKQVTTFVLSHVGLLTLVVGYCVLGAVTFEALERNNEILEKQKMRQVRREVSEYLWNMTKATDLIIPEKWAENATRKLQDFEKDLINAIKKHGWDGSEDETKLNWTFTGALFYAIITISHITPKTVWGKIVTIFYAIVGIPLMVICWSHIGDFMAKSFRVIYWKVCCYICTRRPARRQRGHMRRGRSVRGPPPRSSMRMKQKSIRRSVRASQRSADSAISDSAVSAISDPGVLYGGQRAYASTLPRTIQPRSIDGPGPGHSSKRSTRSAEPEFGPSLPILYNKYAEDILPKSDVEAGAGTASPQRITRNRSVPPELIRQPDDLDYWDDDFDDYEDSDYEEDPGKRPVPIWLCSALVIGYIIGGAFLFSHWEAWNFLDSAYFCFITLTTIGFGDFVPTQESETSIALCSLYLLFGIALLAMSFNLVQEQVINSVKELALTLGIIDEEDDR